MSILSHVISINNELSNMQIKRLLLSAMYRIEYYTARLQNIITVY